MQGQYTGLVGVIPYYENLKVTYKENIKPYFARLKDPLLKFDASRPS